MPIEVEGMNSLRKLALEICLFDAATTRVLIKPCSSVWIAFQLGRSGIERPTQTFGSTDSTSTPWHITSDQQNTKDDG